MRRAVEARLTISMTAPDDVWEELSRFIGPAQGALNSDSFFQ